MTQVTITTLAERPELASRIYEIRDRWPVFMGQDKLANALFHQVASTFPEHCVVATTEDGTLVARGRSIPFAADGPGRELYPEGGWDSVLLWGFSDHQQGREPTAVSALDIVVDSAHLGQGLSKAVLAGMRDAVRKSGRNFVAPVRPTEKHRWPLAPTSEYAVRIRHDGLPDDPWLRVHVRAGGTIVKVAPASMVMTGSLAQWRAWTGLPFDRDGDVEVPEALVPVHCDLTHDYAVYVEPNVWVHHDLGSAE